MQDLEITQFVSGTHNRLPLENIPKDAASESLNWRTHDGVIELTRGRKVIGDKSTTSGKTTDVFVAYKQNGDKVKFRKAGTKIQYLNEGTSTWVDVITGLSATADYSWSAYTSLAGSFIYVSGEAGIFKINAAFPTSYVNMYDPLKNFKGKTLIDKARTLMWDIPNDPTGLRGSWIDAQDSTVYTTVSAETIGAGNGVQTVFTGTLAFKGANPLATCFGMQITSTPTGLNGVDDYNGNITSLTGSSIAFTGTINYTTGAFSITFATPPAGGTSIKATYQWENSNNKGVTDFTPLSGARSAGQGFVIRQDEGGDPIQNVLVGLDGSYYSIKKYSVYRLTLDSTDTKPYNEVFRKNLGIPHWHASCSTQRGIIFINAVDEDHPHLVVLEKNELGDNVLPTEICKQFRFEDYLYDEANIEPYNGHIAIACKTLTSPINNRVILVNMVTEAVDVYAFNAQTLRKDGSRMYMGDSSTLNVYEIFEGNDDDGIVIENYWISRKEKYGSTRLKKFRKSRYKGQIELGQNLGVYLELDSGDFAKIGTIRSDAETIDNNMTGMLGTLEVGEGMVGGMEADTSDQPMLFTYYFELKVRMNKFQMRRIKFVAENYGLVTVEYMSDNDILGYEDRIPKRYRRKQKVSIDGALTNQ